MKARYPILLVFAAIFVTGCVVAPGGHYSGDPQPPVHRAYQVPPPPVGPPPPLREPQPSQPSPAYAWQGGYWDWDGARYFWRPGAWVVAPVGYAWVPHQWVHSSKHGWRLMEGSWRDAGGH